MSPLQELLKSGQFRFQRIATNVPNPTQANQIVEAEAQLDRDFNKIAGIAFFETSAGGVADNYRVGFRTTRRTWIDAININAWDAAANVGPMDKYYEVSIPYGSGDTAYAQLIPNALTNAAMLGEMVLILARDLTEQPRS